MANLYRLDVIIRGNSDIKQDEAVEWTKNWVNRRQEDENNKSENGDYLREYYADLFDSRTTKSWKVFSDVATKNRDIKDTYTTKQGLKIKGIISLNKTLEEIKKIKSEPKAV